MHTFNKGRARFKYTQNNYYQKVKKIKHNTKINNAIDTNF